MAPKHVQISNAIPAHDTNQQQDPQFYPKKGVKRSTEAEWKGLVANLVCVLIGGMFVLCIQSLMGTFGGGTTAGMNRGWKMNQVILRYFDYRGKAEPIRLLLEDAKIEYKEKRYTDEEWLSVKNDTKAFTSVELPQLEDHGAPVVYTPVILKYIGKSTVGYAGMDVFEDLHADIVTEGVDDWRRRYENIVYDPYFTQEKLDQYLKQVMPQFLRQLEVVLTKGSKKWFVGDRITYVDFYAWDTVELHKHLDEDCLYEYPLLTAWFKRLGTRQRVKSYLKSKRRPVRVNSYTAAVDNKVGI